MGGRHVAEPGAIVKHVVPGRCRAVSLFGQVRKVQVGSEPRRIVARRCGAAQLARHCRPSARQQKKRCRPDQPLRLDALGFITDQRVDRDRCLAFLDPPGERPGNDASLGAAGEAARQPGIALGRGKHGIGMGIGRLTAAAGKVVQPGPGRRLRIVGPEVVSASVVGEPMQGRRGKALVEQPLPEVGAVQCQPLRIAAGKRHRQREQATPVAPAGVLELVHVHLETLLLGTLPGVKAAVRKQPLVPQAVAEDAFLRGRAQEAFLVGRPLGARIAMEHAEFGKQFADEDGLRPGQRQVVCPPRVGNERRAAGARVAARFALQVEDQEVIGAGPGQPPGGGQPGDAGTDDDGAGPAGTCRR